MNNEKKAPVRPIKFRGLRVDGKGWAYGDLLQNYIHHKSGATIQQGGCIVYEVMPETVGQFTGRTDVNGAEIYEGDKVLHGESERFVEYRWTNFVLTRIEKTGTILLSFSDKPRVIGNIHEESDINSIEGKETNS